MIKTVFFGLRIFWFTLLTILIVSQLTYFSVKKFTVSIGGNEESFENKFTFTYQFNDKELIPNNTDDLFGKSISNLTTSFAKISTKSTSLLGIPLDFIRHQNCIFYETKILTDSGSILTHYNPIPLVISFSDDRETELINKSTCFNSPILDINVDSSSLIQASEIFRDANIDQIKKNCIPRKDNPNDCDLSGLISFRSHSVLINLGPSLIFIVIIGITISSIFFGKIIPISYNYFSEGISKKDKQTNE